MIRDKEMGKRDRKRGRHRDRGSDRKSNRDREIGERQEERDT